MLKASALEALTAFKAFLYGDKPKHFAFGVVFALPFATIAHADTREVLAIWAAFLIGAFKELYDEFVEGGTGFDFADLAATTLGGVYVASLV